MNNYNQSLPHESITRHQWRKNINRTTYQLVFALLTFALVGCGSISSTTQSSTPTATRTVIPTKTSVPAAQSGATTLGQPLSHFVTRYGQPNDHSDAKSGAYHLERYGNSNIDFLILQTDIFDGPLYAQSVESITAQSPEAAWTGANADAICAGFLPPDAKYQSQVSTAYGYDKIYASASLASLFPDSAFVDANQNQTTAGSFDVDYITRSPSDVTDCTIAIGTQQTQ